jgi:hypothetical protein
MKIESFEKKIGFILFLILSLTHLKVGAQNFFGQPYKHIHDEKCAHVLIEKMQEEKLGIYGSKEYFETWITGKIDQKKKNATAQQRTQADPRLIPVVVHVIHNGTPVGSGANIPLSQIEAQIRILNEDFQKTESRCKPDSFRIPWSCCRCEHRICIGKTRPQRITY